jgi:SIT4-associating protein SAP185/190
MNKRNAAAAAAANGGQEGSAPPTTEDTAAPGAFTLPSTTSGERLRNPFADYDDDEDNSGSGSDDGEVENVEGDSRGVGATSSAWNRGSWWRGVVRGTRRGGGSGALHDDQDVEVERFGDGRDDDSSDEEGGRRLAGDEDDIEDEEFGDFAMPEVEERVGGAGVSGIDPARESILVKPMPLHPTPTTTLKSSTISPFSSLWPFSREKREDEPSSSGQGEGSNAGAPAAGSGVGITEEPVELTHEEEAMLSEDGKRIDRAVEAKRRTSIEDPDEDEVDVGEEIIVHRAPGIR